MFGYVGDEIVLKFEELGIVIKIVVHGSIGLIQAGEDEVVGLD